MTMEVRFVSGNKYKIDEAQRILAAKGVLMVPRSNKIEELQTTNTTNLVRDKLLKAFEIIGRPLFVEHTGLYLEHLKGFPGGLTQIFWDALRADRFSELFGKLAPNKRVIARTFVAYTNSKTIWIFEGAIAGEIVPEPRGTREFQWDCVFQPDGYTQTFAEMGDKKNEISMRRKALDKLAAHLEQ